MSIIEQYRNGTLEFASFKALKTVGTYAFANNTNLKLIHLGNIKEFVFIDGVKHTSYIFN